MSIVNMILVIQWMQFKKYFCLDFPGNIQYDHIYVV